jgi:hypothetical protein
MEATHRRPGGAGSNSEGTGSGQGSGGTLQTILGLGRTILICTATAFPAWASAQSVQADALGFLPPGLEGAVWEVEQLEAESSAWGQIDYSARLGPVVRYRHYPGEEDGDSLSARFGLLSRIDFGDPPATLARSLQALERARDQLATMQRVGTRAALVAHGNLLLAQEAEARAGREFQEAEGELGEASGGQDLAELELEARLADLDYRRAAQDLNVARREAVAHGLASTAAYEPLRFVLPRSVDPRSTHDYRMLELALLEAQAEVDEERRRPLDDLRLRAAYRTRGAQLDVTGGIINGTPGATLGLSVPGGLERWEIELSAQLLLDDSWTGLESLERAVSDARAGLDAYIAQFEVEFSEALVSTHLAEEAVTLAEEVVALAENAAALAEEEAARSNQAGRAQAASVRRAREDLATRQSRLYRTWLAYVRSTEALLELTDGQLHARQTQ